MRSLVVALGYLICLTTALSFAQAELNESTESETHSWVAFGVGLPLVQLQYGLYDPEGSGLATRFFGAFGAPLAPYELTTVGAEVLWFSEKRSGFYLGAGLNAMGHSRVFWVGPHLTLGYDFRLKDSTGIILDASLGVAPLIVPLAEPYPNFVPIHLRLGLSYRIFLN